jgi:hypothetical protein
MGDSRSIIGSGAIASPLDGALTHVNHAAILVKELTEGEVVARRAVEFDCGSHKLRHPWLVQISAFRKIDR